METIQPYAEVVNLSNNNKIGATQTKQTHYAHLILALLILQPPVITSVYTIRKIKTSLNTLDDEANYTYIKPDQAFAFITNHDKVSSTSNIDLKRIELYA
jgi:hypothetical protein